jgi:hypothetical protein
LFCPLRAAREYFVTNWCAHITVFGGR